MNIVFTASECAPWAQTGGLGNVLDALPRALAHLGHRISIYLPYYRQVAKLAPKPPVLLPSLTIPFPTSNRFARILDGGFQPAPTAATPDAGVQTYFVDCPDLFDREGIYGPPTGGDYPDNAERFGLLSRATLEAAKLLGPPDLFHAHDWQTALVPILLRSTYSTDPVLRRVPSLLTVHNAGYQGIFPASAVQTLLLPPETYVPNRLEFYGQVNLLQGGISLADALTTVSHKYAEEIQTADFGHGLETVLHQRRADLSGILNGADYDEWNTATDPHIAAHYTATDLRGKRECRRDLLHGCGFEPVEPTTAVVGMISRLATQKGFDLFAEALPQLMAEDILLIILGAGEPFYERLLDRWTREYPQKIRVLDRFSPVMAHKIQAGADLFLMPSRSEPCGLNQMYSLRYGTVPVVHATGGLDDTVDDSPTTGTGFKFQAQTAPDLLDALRRTLAVYRNPVAWSALQRRGMLQDFSWTQPAQQYAALYTQLIRQGS